MDYFELKKVKKMPKGYKGGRTSLGKALQNAAAKKRSGMTESKAGKHTIEYGGNKGDVGNNVKSVLERDEGNVGLEEFMATAELARQEFDAERLTWEMRQAEPLKALKVKPEFRAAFPELEVGVRVLRRPHWTSSMSPEELRLAEEAAFLGWRGELANLEEQGLVLSPFEKNLDFWRQLWRTVEKSDLVVQIVDARDPLFFYCQDLDKYVQEVGEFQGRRKQTLVLLNKGDYVSEEVRRQWLEYFGETEVDCCFFSALLEIKRRLDVDKDLDITPEEALLGAHVEGSLLDAEQLGKLLLEKLTNLMGDLAYEAADALGTIGFTGSPNVGKSSVINALVGAKKVSVSRQPGKTKHIQTLKLKCVDEAEEETDSVILCDCPGLVMPSVVASKAHLTVNGVLPLDHLREFKSSVEIVVSRLGLKHLLDFYSCRAFYLPEFRALGDARGFLCAYAVSRKYFLMLNLPDESKAARNLLKDYCRGRIVWAAVPPGAAAPEPVSEDDFVAVVTDEQAVSECGESGICLRDEYSDSEVAVDEALELADLREFREMQKTANQPKAPTVRALRMQAKQEVKAGRQVHASEAGAGAAGRSTAGYAEAVNLPLGSRPGGKGGRVRQALLDPYGCHRKDQFYI